MALHLPDDVLLEIFARVEEVAALFRCATACKRWLSLFADRSFLRHLWPDQNAFSLIGFIAKDKRHGRPEGVNGLVIPAPRSGLDPACRALRSFMPAAYAKLLEGAVPLASRHGLLLLRLGSTLADSNRSLVHMAVCNMLASTCDVLPPLKLGRAYDDHEWCGYALLTDIDCGGSIRKPLSDSPFFKVVIIGSDEDNIRYNLYMFSSCKVSWSTHIGCLGIDASTCQPFSDVMVHRGMAHWLREWFYIITLNIQTGHLSYTNLHVPLNFHHTGHPCLTLTKDENLALLWMKNAGPQLEILAQRPNVGGNLKWLATRTIELKRQRRDMQTEKRGLYILEEKCGIILVKDGHQQVYTVELKTGMMVEVVGWPDRCRIVPWEPVPLEMDWPSFFISRLCIRDSTRDVGEKVGGRSRNHDNASEEIVV